jgi:hypothetical protein
VWAATIGNSLPAFDGPHFPAQGNGTCSELSSFHLETTDLVSSTYRSPHSNVKRRIIWIGTTHLRITPTLRLCLFRESSGRKISRC